MALAQAATRGRVRMDRLNRSLFGTVMALALAGCAAGENLDGAFGAQDTGVATGGTAGGVTSSERSLTVGTGPDAVVYDCPPVMVRTGAATWQVTDSGALRYQGNLGQLARECIISGQTMLMKVGIEGRVLIGEKGTPGTVKVPMRVAVVQEGPNPKTITTKFFTVPVEVPAGQTQQAFAVVEDQISLPLPKPDEMSRYVVYVGYDPQGEKPKPAASRPRPKPSQAPSAAAAAKPKPAAAPPAMSAAPKADPGAPSDDVFGPPPSGPTGGAGKAGASGGFAPPPASNAFEPPPR